MKKNLMTELYEFHESNLRKELHSLKKYVSSKFFNGYVDYKSRELAYFTYMDMDLLKKDFYFHDNLQLSLNDYLRFREHIEDFNLIDEFNLFYEQHPNFDFAYQFILGYGSDNNLLNMEVDYFQDIKERHNLKFLVSHPSLFNRFQILKFMNEFIDLSQDFVLLGMNENMNKWLFKLKKIREEGYFDDNHFIDRVMHIWGIEDEQCDVLIAILNDELSEEMCYEMDCLDLYDKLHQKETIDEKLILDKSFLLEMEYYLNLTNKNNFIVLNDVEKEHIQMAKESIYEKYPHLNPNNQKEPDLRSQFVLDEGFDFQEEVSDADILIIRQRFNDKDFLDNGFMEHNRLMLEDFFTPVINSKTNPLSLNELENVLNHQENQNFHFTEKLKFNKLEYNIEESYDFFYQYSNNMGICVFDHDEIVYRLSVFFPHLQKLNLRDDLQEMDEDKFFNFIAKSNNDKEKYIKKLMKNNNNHTYNFSIYDYAGLVYDNKKGMFKENLFKSPNQFYCEIDLSSSNKHKNGYGYSQYAYNKLCEFAYENNVIIMRNCENMTSMGSRYLRDKFHNAKENNPNVLVLEYVADSGEYFPQMEDFYRYSHKVNGIEQYEGKGFCTTEEVKRVVDFYEKYNNMSLEEFKVNYIKEMIDDDFLKYRATPQFNEVFADCLYNLKNAKIESHGIAKLTSQEYVYLKEYYEKHLNRFHEQIKEFLMEKIDDDFKKHFITFITMDSFTKSCFGESIKHLAKEGESKALEIYLKHKDEHIGKINNDVYFNILTNLNHDYEICFDFKEEMMYNKMFSYDDVFQDELKEEYKQKKKSLMLK